MSFQLYFLFLITLLSTVHNINSKASSNTLKNNEAVKYLITSSTGMQFYKIDKGPVKLIYDCTLGLSDEGVIDVYDNLHPENTESISVENCKSITLRICPENLQQNRVKFDYLEELLVKNINTMSFFTGCKSDTNYYGNYGRNYDNIFGHITGNNHFRNFNSGTMTFEDSLQNSKRFYINNVKNLKLLQRSCADFSNVALSIENTTIGKLYTEAISSGVTTLQLQNVKINEFEEKGIYLNNDNKNFDPVLIIKDCQFGTVDRDIIFVNGSEVEISNNYFQYLGDNVFTINATKKFNFSDNYIRKMNAPFNVWSSNIHVTRNTFDMNKKPWIAGLRILNGPGNRVLNVSQNSMKIYPQQYFAMDPASSPDVITFDSNNFNCTCQHWHFSEFENSDSAYLLRKHSGNVCANLGNCPLWKALRHMPEICNSTFNCSQAEKPKISTETYLQMILSTLKDMQAALHSLASKNKVFTFSNEIDKTGEEPITVEPFDTAP